MATHRNKPKAAWLDDPMVPIDPRRLRALIVAKDWSIQKLAKAIHTHSQTLDNLCKGTEPKSTRQSRRAAIAKQMDVSEGWLEGREYLLTGLTSLSRELTLSLSPRMQLEVTALMRKVERAFHRDWYEDQERGEFDEMHRSYHSLDISWGVLRLLRLDTWREQLTTWRRPEGPPGAELYDAPGLMKERPDLYTSEEDQVGLAMITMFSAVLRPWFEGTAKLDYNRLRVLIGYDRHGEDPHGPEYPLYKGGATTTLNLRPDNALGRAPWAKL